MCGVLGIMLSPRSAIAQTTYEEELKARLPKFLAPMPEQPKAMQSNALLPDDASGTLVIPSGFGGSGKFIFGGLGGAFPEVYTDHKVDLNASLGFCVGDPVKAINFATSVNMGSTRHFNDFSANAIVSRALGNGSSISAGALQLFASRRVSDAPKASYYIAFSHAIQGIPSITPGCSRLSYTIGIGTGRFYDKSMWDIENGRGAHGTAIFGGIAYEVIQHLNAIAEWTGTNLGIGAAARPFSGLPVSLGLGVINLTRFTSDKKNMIFSIGLPLSLTRTR